MESDYENFLQELLLGEDVIAQDSIHFVEDSYHYLIELIYDKNGNLSQITVPGKAVLKNRELRKNVKEIRDYIILLKDIWTREQLLSLLNLFDRGELFVISKSLGKNIYFTTKDQFIEKLLI
jgi:hypothetical protein